PLPKGPSGPNPSRVAQSSLWQSTHRPHCVHALRAWHSSGTHLRSNGFGFGKHCSDVAPLGWPLQTGPAALDRTLSPGIGSAYAEVSLFTATFISQLALAMHLRSQPLTDEDYYRQAAAIQQTIVSVSAQPAQDLGIRHIQDIFRDHADVLYHWVDNRNVRAENNSA